MSESVVHSRRLHIDENTRSVHGPTALRWRCTLISDSPKSSPGCRYISASLTKKHTVTRCKLINDSVAVPVEEAQGAVIVEPIEHVEAADRRA